MLLKNEKHEDLCLCLCGEGSGHLSPHAITTWAGRTPVPARLVYVRARLVAVPASLVRVPVSLASVRASSEQFAQTFKDLHEG